MVLEHQSRQPALETWQAIADYLGVAKRTAQNYERYQRLPVYRMDGDKARVWAYAEELDTWRERFRPEVAEDSHPRGVLAGIERQGSEVPTDLQLPTDPLAAPKATALSVDPAKPIPPLILNKGIIRRQWLRYAMVATCGVGGGLAAVNFPRLFRGHQRPTAWRVDGATIIITGAGGDEIWRHTFPSQLQEDWYKARAPKIHFFADLDGDGQIETLFPYVTLEDPSSCNLICFNADGRIRWTFKPGKGVTDNLGHQFVPPYMIVPYAVAHAPNSRGLQVVVSSLHNWSFPCQVVVLDGKSGRPVSEYWHRGHLRHIIVTDLDRDGHPEVLLGGVNDAPDYKCATMAIFDHRRISGASCDPHGQPYFQNMSRGTEKWTIYFPKTPISMRAEFNIVSSLKDLGDRIGVVVNEGIAPEELAAYVVYELDYNLQPINAMLSGDLIAQYKQLQASGTVPVESPYIVAERLMRQIRVVKGS